MHDERLTITTRAEGSVTIVALRGDLDLGTLPAAKDLVQRALDEGRSRLLFDLDEVGYIDSSGLGFLIGSLKKVRERQGDLKVARVNNYLMGIFKLLNLHEVLEVHDDFDTALASFDDGGRTE